MDSAEASSNPQVNSLPASLQVRAPHFPYACGPDIERLAKLVCSYTSSLFLQPEIPGKSKTARQHDVFEIKRAELNALEEQLRVHFLETQVLRSSLQKAEAVLEGMDERLYRKRVDVKKHLQRRNLQTGSRRNATLPPELVSKICEFSYTDERGYKPVSVSAAWQESKLWGEVVYKSIPFTVSVSDLQRSSSRGLPAPSWAKASKFVLRTGSLVHSEKVSRIILDNRWILQKRIQFLLGVKIGSEGLEQCMGILGACKDVSRIMEKLMIRIEPVDTHTALDFLDNPCHGHSECRGCTTVDAPRCTEAEVPLHYLPCLGPSFKAIQLLTLNHVSVPFGSPLTTFSSYFRTLDGTRLETLIIHGSINFNQATRFFSRSSASGLFEVFPRLKDLELDIEKLDGEYVALILNALGPEVAAQLKSLRLRNLFWSVGPDSDLLRRLGWFKGMLAALAIKCPQIHELGFYAPFKEVGGDDGRRDITHQQQMVGALLSHLTPRARAYDNVPLLFPMLDHFTIPCPGAMKFKPDLIRYLEYRKSHQHALRTLTIATSSHNPDDPEGMLDESEGESLRLGLYVREVIRI